MRLPISTPHTSRSSRCAALAVALLLASCATIEPPKPWQKGDLARPEMRFDADPANTRLTDHIYTSKEAGSGGYGVGGGGCGCN